MVIAAAPADDADELVFMTKNAQLLRFSASAVRAQGRTGQGMAGIKLAADDQVIFFGVVPAGASDAVVATIAAGSQTLPGTSGQSVKLTEFSEFPAKGRATAGVRAHRFVKGEDHLQLAYAGQGPARASSSAGGACIADRIRQTRWFRSPVGPISEHHWRSHQRRRRSSGGTRCPGTHPSRSTGSVNSRTGQGQASSRHHPGEDALPFDDGGIIL